MSKKYYIDDVTKQIVDRIREQVEDNYDSIIAEDEDIETFEELMEEITPEIEQYILNEMQERHSDYYLTEEDLKEVEDAISDLFQLLQTIDDLKDVFDF